MSDHLVPCPDPPDVVTLVVPLGARVLVAADLRLSGAATPASAEVSVALARAVRAWSGPGVLIFNGGLFAAPATGDLGAGDLGTGDALAAHPGLTEAVATFSAGGAARRVLALPGDADAALAWSPGARAVLAEQLGAEVALAADLHISTAAGTRRVRVEPGTRLDELSARVDPRNPGETPFAHHLRTEMVDNVRRARGAGAAEAGWLAGLDNLDDPAAFPRFLASRLAYRKLGRHAWLLLLPFVAAFVLRLPTTILARAHGGLVSGTKLGFLVAATLVELAVLAGLAIVSLRRTWDALASMALGGERRSPNDAPRAAGRDLVTAGIAGLITSHTSRPELANFGPGFYANTGCVGVTVTEAPCRVDGLGLPSVFFASRQVSWVELEAGSDLHVRLVHGRQQLRGATRLERLAARRPGAADGLHIEVVASFPQGPSWPPPPAAGTRRRRVRRIASVFVAAAGFVSLVSSLSEPLRDRLHYIQQILPIVVPEVATALAALGGLGLLVLARGVRRGQRRAWAICLIVLAVVAVLHLIKGGDVVETVVALAVAGFLWVNRASFSAASDTPRLGSGLLGVVGAAGTVVVAGTLGIELGSWIAATRHPALRRIPWGQALQASAERLVGFRHVVLNHALDEFFSPAMATVGVALGVALAWLALRPVVARRAEGGEGRRDLLHRETRSAAGRRIARAGARAWVAVPGVPASAPGWDRARDVVARYGAGTLDYFALRSDKDFFFWGATVVAYAVYSGSCLVSPDPIGPTAEREEAWRAFRSFVDKRGWTLGVLGAGEEWLPIYRGTGMHDLYLGDEGVVRTARFTLQGGRFKGLRQAVNRVAKYGYTISFHDPSSLDPALRAELEAVMTKSRRGDVERGFSMTLGRVFRPEDRGLLLAVVHGPSAGAEGGARGAGPHAGSQAGAAPLGATVAAPCGSEPTAGSGAGPVVAFCQYVPAPGIGGYSLDLMRRDNGEHPNGLIDFAVVETIRHLQAQGSDGLGLNFATMRAVLAGEAGEGLSQRVQAWLLRRMGDSMQIESLWRFNAKFDPDWQPRYAIYDAPENALSTAIAVARAESFWELPVIGRWLVPSGERAATDRAPGGRDAEAPSLPVRISPRKEEVPRFRCHFPRGGRGRLTAERTPSREMFTGTGPAGSEGLRLTEA